jgi:hypothetical protein
MSVPRKGLPAFCLGCGASAATCYAADLFVVSCTPMDRVSCIVTALCNLCGVLDVLGVLITSVMGVSCSMHELQSTEAIAVATALCEPSRASKQGIPCLQLPSHLQDVPHPFSLAMRQQLCVLNPRVMIPCRQCEPHKAKTLNAPRVHTSGVCGKRRSA